MQLYCFAVIRDYYYYYPGDTHTHTRAPTAVFAPYAVARMPSNAVPITCTMSDIEKSSLNQSRLNKANSNREQ